MAESIEQPAPVGKHDPLPLTWEGLFTLGPIIIIAVLGGVVNFMRKVREGETRPLNIVELIGELFTSGFAGVIAYWLVHTWIGNPFVEAATVGMAGHAGSRALFLLEKWVERRAETFNPLK